MKPTTVLLVEDEVIIAMSILRELGSRGFRTLPLASDGASAIKAIERAEADIILMDINLPGGHSGLDLARLALARYAPRVIFMSGYPREEVLQGAPDLLSLEFLEKPVDAFRLLGLLGAP